MNNSSNKRNVASTSFYVTKPGSFIINENRFYSKS